MQNKQKSSPGGHGGGEGFGDKLLFETPTYHLCHPERNEVESKDLKRKGLGFVGKDMKTEQ